MKRANTYLEWRILATLCNTNNPELKGKLALQLKENLFGTKATEEIYRKLVYQLDAGKELPKFQDIPDMLNISSETSILIKTLLESPKPLKKISFSSCDIAIEQLYDYRRMRIFADLYSNLGKQLVMPNPLEDNALEKDKDPIESMRGLLEEAQRLTSSNNEDIGIVNAGVSGDDTMTEVVSEVLSGKQCANRLKTGFNIFDKKSGGFDRGNLVVLSSTSGGGKSVLLLHMLTEMYITYHYKIVNVSLEMTKEEVTERMLAHISGIGVSNIHLGELTSEERNNIVESFNQLNEPLGGRYTTFCPSEDLTAQEILQTLAPYNYDVIAIDYLQLMKLTSSKNSNKEQAINDTVRYLKHMAQKMNCVIILVSQLNGEGQVRDSKSIEFHSSFWWSWECTEEDKQRGFITVEQKKARFGKTFPFYLTADFEHMRMDTYIPDDEDVEEITSEKKKTRNKDRIETSLTEDL